MQLDLTFLHTLLPFIRAQSAGGRIWLIGGQVYRRLVERLYGVPCASLHDIDILYERRKAWNDLVVLDGWSLMKTGLGGARFQKESIQIDAVSLDESINPWDSLPRRTYSVEEKCASFLRRAPLTVQSCMLDIDIGLIVGEVGLRAIQERRVDIYNEQECCVRCARHNESSEDYRRRMRASLGFEEGGD